MSTFPKNIDRVFVVNSIAPAGIRACDLKPTQIGLLDIETQRTVTSASVCSDARYQWVYKSTSPGMGGKVGDFYGVSEPIRSIEFEKVDMAKAFEGATSESKPMIAYLGNDGVSDCKTLSFDCGKTYGITIALRGKDIRDTFGRNIVETAAFTTGCCENCSIDEACSKTADTIVKEIYNQMFYIPKYIDIDKITNCCPAPTPFPRVNFQDFCISICDNGDDAALAEVQVQYQNLDIYRESRKDSTSTYKVDCVLAAPDPYVQTGSTISNCNTCSTGFTLVPAGKKYIVTIDNAGTDVTAAAWLTAVQAAGAFSVATSAKKLSFDGSISTYEVIVPATFVEPTAPIAETTFRFVSDVKSYCVQTTPITTNWAACGTKYKIKRKLCLTVKNGDCNATSPDLVEIQKLYSTVTDIVPASIVLAKAGDCNSVYEIEQYSNCLEDGCDTVGADKAKFAELMPYKGQYWQMCQCEGWTVDAGGCPVPPPATPLENCLCGIKFVGKFIDNEYNICSYDVNDVTYREAVEFEVSITDMSNDNDCKTKVVDWTVVQTPQIAKGFGADVLKEEIKSRSLENFMYVSPNAEMGNLIKNKIGFNFEAKPEKFYNNVQVAYWSDTNRNHYKLDKAYRERSVFYVESHKSKLLGELKTLVNSLVTAKGGCKTI